MTTKDTTKDTIKILPEVAELSAKIAEKIQYTGGKPVIDAGVYTETLPEDISVEMVRRHQGFWRTGHQGHGQGQRPQ